MQKSSDKFKEHIGIEYIFRKLLFVRTGYKIGYDAQGLTFGLGANYNQLSLNYALSPMKDLDLTHYVGLTYKLDFSLRETEEKIEEEIPKEVILEKKKVKEKHREKAPLVSRSGNMEIQVKIHEDLEWTMLYVRLKNVGTESIFVHLNNFTLKTKKGSSHLPDITKTYTTKGSFPDGKSLSSNSEAGGFIIFNTKEIPKSLTYEDLFGNTVFVDIH